MSLQLDALHHGECLAVLRTLPDESVDSICTDPPYGLGLRPPTVEEILAYLNGADLKTGDFMNKPWDIPPLAVWKECFRILKPGGHLLAFAGTRTLDLMSIAIRIAGFENRDTIAAHFGPSIMQWVQSQGFPKSHSVDKGIDRKKGAKRKVTGTKRGVGGENLNDIVNGREVRQTTDEGGKGVGAYGVGAKQVAVDIPITEPATPEAKQWEGWGTALKPSWEPVLVFRKPLFEKSVVDQVLATGTGAINIDGCRVGASADDPNHRPGVTETTDKASSMFGINSQRRGSLGSGRWPANFLLVHGHDCKEVGTKKVKAPIINRFNDGMKPFGDGAGHGYTSTQTGDLNGEEEIPIFECMEGCPVKAMENQSHGSSRFFAQFKPDPPEAPFTYCSKATPAEKDVGAEVEDHPTVKPLQLMRYLVRLVTPRGGVVLDPYVGSGTTAVAAILEGMHYVAIEKHEAYIARAHLRIVQVTSPNWETNPPKSTATPASEMNFLLDLALSD